MDNQQDFVKVIKGKKYFDYDAYFAAVFPPVQIKKNTSNGIEVKSKP